MADGMLEVFDYVLERWSRGEPVKFRNLDDIITALHSGQYVDACQSCALGSFTAQSITVNHDGTFGPCDVSAGMDEHRLGNVHECRGDLRERMADAMSFRVFKRLDDVEGCSTCAFKLTCAGGCEEESMRIGREKNHYCAYYYRVFAAVAVHLQELERIGYVSHVLGDGRRYEHASLAS